MRRKNQKSKLHLPSIIKGGLTVLISVFMIFTVVKASTITPPSGEPSAQFYTLSEIYEFITSNTDAGAAGSHDFNFSDALTGTHRTLTEIYTALASRISAAKVKIGTTYLGVVGTLYGDTDPTKVLTVSGGTYNATNVTAGNVKSGITFGVADTGTLAPDGTAAATDCLDAKTFYSANSWTQKTGSIATRTLSADSATVSAGYYAATTLSAVDADLTEGYIKKNTAIFGITGTLYGDTDSTKVCSNASAAGTLTIDASKVLSSATYCGTGGSIANCSLEGGNACYANSGYWTATAGNNVSGAEGSISFSIPNGYYSGKTCMAVDGDLITTNIKSGVNLFGVNGDPNVVNTSSGDAVLTDILSGKKCWVDGAEVTGNVTAGGNVSGAEGSKVFTIPDGLYSSSKTCTANDNDLAEGNIKSGINIFGVNGTAPVVTGTGTGSVAAASQILTNYYAWGATGAVIQGSGAAYGIPKTGQTAESVDYDDGHYQSGKPASGTHYQLNADTITITDNATGLMWLKDPSLAGGDTYLNTWASALNTPTTMTWANAITNCEALTYAGYNDWRLPNAKELQSIVNYGNWSPAIGEATLGGSDTRAPWVNAQSDYYWSSTTYAINTAYAWFVHFYNGSVNYFDKTGSNYVRCVRQ